RGPCVRLGGGAELVGGGEVRRGSVVDRETTAVSQHGNRSVDAELRDRRRVQGDDAAPAAQPRRSDGGSGRGGGTREQNGAPAKRRATLFVRDCAHASVHRAGDPVTASRLVR